MITPSMMLITSAWGPQGREKPTFRMIPALYDCPYQECIYDPEQGILAVISKTPKQNYTMVPRINDDGDVMYLKGAKSTRPNGKNYKEERRLVDTYQEYYIETEKEIIDFVKQFSINTDYNFSQYLKKPMPAGEVAFADPAQLTSKA